MFRLGAAAIPGNVVPVNSLNPQLILLAGPNGAGKSTTARVLLPETLHVDEFVNADLIAAGLSPFAPQRSQIAAGRIMLQRMHDLLNQRRSFAIETTLAGTRHASFISNCRASGYRVHIVFVALASPELAKARVRSRVLRGGHDVPVGVIERRFARGLKNLFTTYLPLADGWTLCDNSGTDLIIAAEGTRGEAVRVFSQAIYERCIRQSTVPRL